MVRTRGVVQVAWFLPVIDSQFMWIVVKWCGWGVSPLFGEQLKSGRRSTAMLNLVTGEV